MQRLGNNSVHCSQPIPSKFPSYFNDIYPPPSWKQDTESIYVVIEFSCCVKSRSHSVHAYCLGVCACVFFLDTYCFPNRAWVRDCSQLVKDQQRRWFFFFPEECLGHLNRALTLWGERTKVFMGFLGVDHFGSYSAKVHGNLGAFLGI